MLYSAVNKMKKIAMMYSDNLAIQTSITTYKEFIKNINKNLEKQREKERKKEERALRKQNALPNIIVSSGDQQYNRQQ